MTYSVLKVPLNPNQPTNHYIRYFCYVTDGHPFNGVFFQDYLCKPAHQKVLSNMFMFSMML